VSSIVVTCTNIVECLNSFVPACASNQVFLTSMTNILLFSYTWRVECHCSMLSLFVCVEKQYKLIINTLATMRKLFFNAPQISNACRQARFFFCKILNIYCMIIHFLYLTHRFHSSTYSIIYSYHLRSCANHQQYFLKKCNRNSSNIYLCY